MPATHLVRVDLPAPLSPTSAMTSPDRARKSTPRRACTAPKRLWTPRSSNSGCSLTVVLLLSRRSEGRPAAPLPIRSLLLESRRGAVLLVLALADVARLQEAVLDDGVLDVGLGDRDRREQHGRGLGPLVVRRLG